ncbi:MAG: hypothetical protein IT304_09135, partial [Dehalococcoidia bacterium]|nr:hypothetical protein [Dehalococcoidia bacterium]
LDGWIAENCRWWARGPGSIPGLAAPPEKLPALAIWSPLDFGDRKLWVEHNEYGDGEVEVHDAEVVYGDGVRRTALPALDHDLAFDKESGLLTGGEVTFRDAAGEPLRVVRGPPLAVLSLLGAGFSGDERYRQGQYRGLSFLDHERWDFRASPPAGAQTRFLDYFLETEWEGRKGYGTFELMRA